MPNINIREQEETLYRVFDATENTVLIPLVYARSFIKGEGNTVTYSEVEDIPGMLFTSVNEFKTKMVGKFVYTDAEGRILDRSYVMAHELLLAGLNVVIKPITFDNANSKYHPGEFNTKTIISEDEIMQLLVNSFSKGALEEFKDRNLFNIKFITSGGYANKGLLTANGDTSLALDTKLVEIAEKRGDSIALIELREMFSSKTELLNELKDINPTTSYKYAACFFPWCKFTTSVGGIADEYNMPASFAYLKAYANSVSKNANWFAASGVMRGEIPNLVTPSFEVGESLMHVLQGDLPYDGSSYLSLRINPIYNAGTYGYRIWGNKVFDPTNSAAKSMYMDFLNVRILLCDIKKQTFHAAMRTTFEPNDDIVWINFKGLVNTLLERMVSGRGLHWYKWTKQKADDKAVIKATLTIKPIEAVESFDINIVLTEDETVLTEQGSAV